MNASTILWPIIALVALTFVVQVTMYRRRVVEIRGKSIRLKALATRREAGSALEDTAAADNYSNLFELPVLFYVLGILLFVSGGATVVQLVLAWAFVLTRAVHSAIHLTHNRVRYRFLAFVVGAFILMAMWLMFIIQIAV